MTAGEISFRHATADDAEFLLHAYRCAREGDADIVSRHPDARQAVIEHEFASRQSSYLVNFPGVEFLIICHEDESIGRLYLQRATHVYFVVDLILLPEWRSQGIGSAILEQIIDEAASKGTPVQLHVHKKNARAQALYERHGFSIISDAATHHLMERR